MSHPRDVTRSIIGAAFTVHSTLGPGLLESAYQPCMHFELVQRQGLSVEQQRAVPIVYQGVRLDCGYRLDFVVNESVIVETKAVETLLPVHQAQVLSYMKLTGLPYALLLNFNVVHMRDGIRRFINSSVL